QDLAREVLVKAAVAINARNGVRADRLRVVEIEQHGRVAFDGLQHVDKAPEDVRADRLALVAAGFHRRIGIDAEMVGPEPYQPLDETNLSTNRGLEPSFCLIEK